MTSPAAWLPDPTGKHDHRWWDGDRWTEHVADAGQAAVDPLAPGEQPPAPSDTPSTPSTGAEGTEAATEAAGGWPDGGQTGAGGGEEPGTTPSSADTDARDTGPVWDRPDAGTPSTGGTPPVWGEQGQQGGGGFQGQPQGWDQGQPQGWDQGQQQGWDQQGQPQGWDQRPAWSQQGAQGGWGQPTPTGRNDGVAVAALIIGILSLLVAWIPFIGLIGALGGIVALILGFVARGRIKRTGASGNGMALTGIITGIVALLLGALITIGLFVLGGDLFGESFRSYAECIEETGDEALCQEQLEQDLFDQLGD